jgi:hypothetical protein
LHPRTPNDWKYSCNIVKILEYSEEYLSEYAILKTKTVQYTTEYYEEFRTFDTKVPKKEIKRLLGILESLGVIKSEIRLFNNKPTKYYTDNIPLADRPTLNIIRGYNELQDLREAANELFHPSHSFFSQ